MIVFDVRVPLRLILLSSSFLSRKLLRSSLITICNVVMVQSHIRWLRAVLSSLTSLQMLMDVN